MVAQVRGAVVQMGQVGRFKMHLEKVEEGVESLAEKVSGRGRERSVQSEMCCFCVHLQMEEKWKCPA